MNNTEDVFLKTEKPKFEEVEIKGEKVLCRWVDVLREYEDAFKTADSYRKIGTIEAHKATQNEKIITTQDGMINYCEKGDWIIHNPGDLDSYVFGNKNDSLEVRGEKFNKEYVPVAGQDGIFKPHRIIKAIQINENIVFNNSSGIKMAEKKDGWVTDYGYAIAEDSFLNTYEKI